MKKKYEAKNWRNNKYYYQAHTAASNNNNNFINNNNNNEGGDGNNAKKIQTISAFLFAQCVIYCVVDWNGIIVSSVQLLHL